MCKNWHSRNCDCCSYWDIISLLVVVSAAQGHCGLSSITNRIFSSSPAGKSTSTMNFSSTTTENLVCRSSSRAQSALSHQPAKNEHRQMTWPRLYTTKLVNVGEPEDGNRRRCDHVVTSDDVLIQWRGCCLGHRVRWLPRLWQQHCTTFRRCLWQLEYQVQVDQGDRLLWWILVVTRPTSRSHKLLLLAAGVNHATNVIHIPTR